MIWKDNFDVVTPIVFHVIADSYQTIKLTMKTFLNVLLISFSIIAFSQTPEKISTQNYKFLEGPAWDGTEFIYFSDLNDFKVYKYSTIHNTFALAFSMDTKPNGLMFDSDKNLVICEFSAGKISRRSNTGSFIEYLSEGYNGTRFDNVNDLCIDAKGGVYFTDPSGSNSPNQTARRLYYINPNGTLSVVDDGTGYLYPNGVIISNDGLSLFVNDSQSYNIYKYDIDISTGLLSNKQNFATLTNNNDGDNLSRADGMALDSEENLYVSSKATVQIFNKNGAQTGTINFPTKTTNLVFGGIEKKTLYVTGWNELYKVEIFNEEENAQGFHHPFDLPENNLSAGPVFDKIIQNEFYPNPVSKNVIRMDIGKHTISEINISDISGSVTTIENFQLTDNVLEVQLNSNYKPGLYIISLKTDQATIYNKNILFK